LPRAVGSGLTASRRSSVRSPALIRASRCPLDFQQLRRPGRDFVQIDPGEFGVDPFRQVTAIEGDPAAEVFGAIVHRPRSGYGDRRAYDPDQGRLPFREPPPRRLSASPK